MIKNLCITLNLILIATPTFVFGHYMSKKEQLNKNPLKAFQKAIQRDDLSFFIEFSSHLDHLSAQQLHTLQTISDERIAYINQRESAGAAPIKKDKKKKYTINVYLIPWPIILDVLFMNGLFYIGKGIVQTGRSTYNALFSSYYHPHAIQINEIICELIAQKTGVQEVSITSLIA